MMKLVGGLRHARRAASRIIAPALLFLAAAVCSGEEITQVKPSYTAPENTEGYTLVIVDFKAPEQLEDTVRIGYIINKTIEKNMPVVTVESPPYYVTNEPYRSKLEKYPGNAFLKKGKEGDTFINTDLETLLQQHGHKNIIVVGAIMEICVSDTAKGAIKRGYNVFMSDETSIDSQDSSIITLPNGRSYLYRVTANSPLSNTTISKYKNIPMWDRSSSLDLERVLNLVNK
ncbi:MAG: isochorismatase family protein [Candidatus Woesearchaeota archaeon]|nr:isochorismatase family protein [Candidatus Woesearchaeota archaeon]